MLERLETIIYALGVISALYALISIVSYVVGQIRLYVFPMIYQQPDLRVKYGGNWAIITGGSDGIGKGYALELAERGMNICVLSNYENGIVATIEKYNVKCKYINIDFSETDIYDEIKKEISDILDDIGILINNVGMANNKITGIADQNKSYFTKIINVNVNAMVFMTDLVLKAFVKKNKGLILNTGSISGAFPLPYATMYSSSKSFVEMYSVCLSAELNKTNVEVKCVTPFIVRTQLVLNVTNFSNWLASYGSTWFFAKPSQFCESVIRTFGHTTPIVFEGHWTHSLINTFPYKWLEKTAAANFGKWWIEKYIGLD